jgi:energy-coupling factor transport system permease protein
MLKTLHPLTKLGMCLIWIFASIAVFDPVFQVACAAIPAVLLMVFNRTPPLVVLALTVPFALFGFGFLTTNVLFHEDGGYARQMASETALRNTGASTGIVLFLRAIACGMISAFFALTTDAGALVRSLMASCGLPAKVGYALFSAMQIVPDLAREMQQMRIARAMRAGRLPRRFPGPAELFSLFVPLMAFAIRRAGRSAIAMEARGLSSSEPRTFGHVPRFHVADAVFAALAALTLLLLALRM